MRPGGRTSAPAASGRSSRRSSARRPPGRRVRVAGAGHSFGDLACTDGTLLRLERMDRVLELDRTTGLVRVEAGISLGALERAARRARAGAREPRRHRRADDRRRDRHRDARHRRAAAQHPVPGRVGGARAGRRHDRRALPTAGDPELLRAARVGLGALGVVSAVTLRSVPGLHAARRRRAAAARGGRSSASTSSPTPTTTSSSSPSRTADGRADAHEHAHRRAAATRRRPPGAGSRTCCFDQPRSSGSFCRVGRRVPRAIPADQPPGLAAARRARARRPQPPRLRQPAARPLHGDGVRAAPREHAPRRCARVRDAGRRDRRLRGRLPDRGALRRAPTTPTSARPTAATPATSPCTCTEGMACEPYFRGVEEIMDGLRRPAALGQAPLPDRRDAAPALPATGTASRPCARGSTPRAASPTPTPTASSGRRARPRRRLEEGLPLAAVGRRPRRRSRSPSSRYRRVEALAQLAGLRVAHPHAVADRAAGRRPRRAAASAPRRRPRCGRAAGRAAGRGGAGGRVPAAPEAR